MGLPMANLHDPSLNTNTSTDAQKNGEASPLTDLIAERDKLEEELKALGSVLASHGVTMNTTLTTFDGFPRSDIDVAQIRTTRARIIRLRNDHKTLMTRIDRGLQEHFASNATHGSSDLSPDFRSTPSSATSVEGPFAKVNSVEPGSPAQAAGLRVGDRIQRFGDATWLNNEKLSKVAQTVSQNEGRPIAVTVLRNSAESLQWNHHRLSLTPQRGWGGRGLLGCHLTPE